MTDINPARLDRLEAIARAHGLHEPTCEYFRSVAATWGIQAKLDHPSCDCWLAPYEAAR